MEMIVQAAQYVGWLYLVFINVFAFVMYGMDKRKARKSQWRISEKRLIGLALLGGSVGALLGMRLFHHKTQKLKFKLGIPLIIVLQAAALVFIRVI